MRQHCPQQAVCAQDPRAKSRVAQVTEHFIPGPEPLDALSLTEALYIALSIDSMMNNYIILRRITNFRRVYTALFTCWTVTECA